MATRTSSPPGSRSKSTSSKGRSSTRSRSTSRSRSKPSASSSRSKSRGLTSRTPPRAVRNGPGPILRFFTALGRALAAIWLGIAHAIGGTLRRIGGAARDLEPEQRRDGIGLLLFALAVVAAAAVWWQVPGGVMDFARTVVNGSVGKVGWLVPLMLVLIGWRNMRDPQRNGPVGRQVIGWTSLAFGVLGIVHIANGSPEPVVDDPSPLREGGGAVGYVVSSLLLDVMQTPFVVVPVLLLLAVFGVLVITATPVYQIPNRLRDVRDWLLGQRDPEAEPRAPRARSRRDRRREDRDAPIGDPAYDSPVLEDRESVRRTGEEAPPVEDEEPTAAHRVIAEAEPVPVPPADLQPPSTPRCPSASSS